WSASRSSRPLLHGDARLGLGAVAVARGDLADLLQQRTEHLAQGVHLAGREGELHIVGRHTADRLGIEVRGGFVGHRDRPHPRGPGSRLPCRDDPRAVEPGNPVREPPPPHNKKKSTATVRRSARRGVAPRAPASRPRRIAYSTPILMTSPVSISWASASSCRPVSISRFLAI